MNPTAYPLTWPENMPRTKTRSTSRFQTGLAGALKNVKSSLNLFAADSGKKVESVTISSNVTLGENSPTDPGVAFWFTWDGLSVCIAVDRYPKVQDNLQAIYHIIDGRRTELRHGGLHIVRATFTGFAALPSPTRKTWRAVFGFTEGEVCTIPEIERIFKTRAKACHPDTPNGSHEAMAELNRAHEEALKEYAP